MPEPLGWAKALSGNRVGLDEHVGMHYGLIDEREIFGLVLFQEVPHDERAGGVLLHLHDLLLVQPPLAELEGILRIPDAFLPVGTVEHRRVDHGAGRAPGVRARGDLQAIPTAEPSA